MNLTGDKAIREAYPKVFPYRKKTRLEIKISFPELTWKCQEQAYPDFAKITIHYMPKEKALELKSLKLWLNHYRDVYIGYEKLVSEIFETLWKELDPEWMNIHLVINPRGNMKTEISVKRKSLNEEEIE